MDHPGTSVHAASLRPRLIGKIPDHELASQRPEKGGIGSRTEEGHDFMARLPESLGHMGP
jgi:hypothetical protein